jgi:MFS transporter, SP family, general alpha glucoside:H+ symporter
MGNFFAYPTFKEKFGAYYGVEKGWQVSGPWQTGLSMGSTVGTIFGKKPSIVFH